MIVIHTLDTTNDFVRSYNDFAYSKHPLDCSISLTVVSGVLHSLLSTDRTADVIDQCRFPIEFLNSQNPPGLPPHLLQIKIGAPIILLRNLNPRRGLCKGTRLIVLKVSNTLIEAKRTIAVTSEEDDIVLIPRIDIATEINDLLPVSWIRRQFPIKPAFALTINKSQGQTFSRVGVYLEKPVFCHGQLYVALSRVSNSNNLRVVVPLETEQNNPKTKNIVFKEVL